MRRRRSYARSGFGLGGAKGIASKAALGLGAVSILAIIAPQFSQNKIAQAGAGYFLGGPVAAGVAYLFGGNGGGNGMGGAY